MHALITGSFRQHNPESLDQLMSALEISYPEITKITTGLWVGTDQLVCSWGRSNGVPTSQISLEKVTIPNDVELVAILTCHNDYAECETLVDAAKRIKIPVVLW